MDDIGAFRIGCGQDVSCDFSPPSPMSPPQPSRVAPLPSRGVRRTLFSGESRFRLRPRADLLHDDDVGHKTRHVSNIRRRLMLDADPSSK